MFLSYQSAAVSARRANPTNAREVKVRDYGKEKQEAGWRCWKKSWMRSRMEFRW